MFTETIHSKPLQHRTPPAWIIAAFRSRSFCACCPHFSFVPTHFFPSACSCIRYIFAIRSPPGISRPTMLTPFAPGRPAREADAALKSASATEEAARKCAVLWFGEILERGLYRELGYASMQAYARVELGYSETRIGDFMRLARKLEQLPAVKPGPAGDRLHQGPGDPAGGLAAHRGRLGRGGADPHAERADGEGEAGPQAGHQAGGLAVRTDGRRIRAKPSSRPKCRCASPRVHPGAARAVGGLWEARCASRA